MLPKFTKILMPTLEHLNQVKEASYLELIMHTKEQFNLSEEDMRQAVSSNKAKTIIYDRVTWATTYLKKYGLIERPKRGVCKITDFGKKELQNFKDENIQELNLKILKRYEPLRDSLASSKNQDEKNTVVTTKNIDVVEHNETPQETMDVAHSSITQDLKDNLIERIFESSPFFFERLVVSLLINLGYGGSDKESGQAFQTTRDGGIDGTIYEDKLGLDLIHVQAKRWESQVGRPEIQKFAGALQGERVKKGVFITTSGFTKDAKEYVKRLDYKIILIDGDQLTDLMIQSGTGVSTELTYEIKKINSNYFEEAA